MFHYIVNAEGPTSLGPFSIPHNASTISVFINPEKRVRVTAEISPPYSEEETPLWVKVIDIKTNNFYQVFHNVGEIRFETTGNARIAIAGLN